MGWVILIVLAALGLGTAVLFGYQTWELVNWVLPQEAMLMKILAVLAFDGFSYLWLAASRFLKYQLRPGAKGWCQVTGVIDLVLSLICSIIQMNIAEAERYVYQIDIHLVYLANIIIVAAVVLNLVTLLAVVHIQFPDNTEEEAPVQVQQQSSQPAAPPAAPSTSALSPVERQQLLQLAQLLEQMQQPRTTVQEVTGQLEAVQPPDPFAQSPLEIPTRPTGSQNGNRKV